MAQDSSRQDIAARTPPRKPPWIKVRLAAGAGSARLRRLVRTGALHTVCEEALCPNQGLCWAHGRATLMILGGTCTRGCAFCNVHSGEPAQADPDEPARVAQAVREMGLREAVITSVTRDDLPDGGAALWAETVRRIRAEAPGILIEVLVPDFAGSAAALDTVLEAAPDVVGHNLETVPELYDRVRPAADVERSLALLQTAHARGFVTKTGLMLGLGETHGQVLDLARRARGAGCNILSLGQYLQPSPAHLPVARYVPPAEFETLRAEGLAMGFEVVVSAPLVRSSFHSEEQSRYLRRALNRRRAEGDTNV